MSVAQKIRTNSTLHRQRTPHVRPQRHTCTRATARKRGSSLGHRGRRPHACGTSAVVLFAKRLQESTALAYCTSLPKWLTPQVYCAGSLRGSAASIRSKHPQQASAASTRSKHPQQASAASIRSKHPQQASAASIRSVRLAYIQGGSSRRRFRDFLCSVKTCHTANSPVVKPYCGKKLS
jgi:hypothetical protein